jgi:hypothetical protein
MVGPNFPIKVDSNGNGRPGSGDESIVPRRSGSDVIINSRWSNCDPGSNANRFTLSHPDSSGRYRRVFRTNGTRGQTVTITGFTRGAPTEVSWSEIDTGGDNSYGSGALLDVNGNGIFDTLMISGGVSATVSFVHTSGQDYISIPWSQASLLGVDFSATCGGSQPQIWIPLADTNGDGLGDTIVLDLNGNGRADDDFFQGPPLAAAPAPTLGAAARAVLTLLLGGIAVWFLSRRGRAAMSPS